MQVEPLLKNKVVLITGAARGIGRAEAIAFAQQGAELILVDNGCAADGTGQDPQPVQDVAKFIRRHYGRASAYAVDVRDHAEMEQLINKETAERGRIDALVFAAGILRHGPLQNLNTDDWETQIAIQIKSLLAISQLAWNALRQSASASLLFHTSANWNFGVAHQALGLTCAAALVGLTRSLAVELQRHKIRVNAIAPTAKTRLTEALPLFSKRADTALSAEQVAQVAAFLISDLAQHITGEIVGVAGQRIYTYELRETPGHYFEQAADADVMPQALAEHWNKITKAL